AVFFGLNNFRQQAGWEQGLARCCSYNIEHSGWVGSGSFVWFSGAHVLIRYWRVVRTHYW
ncbi:MAG: hypothetical protein IKP40_04165, partial [Clostridia bacterium]|nr:hypothetical protein [Clostridia bacterium]